MKATLLILLPFSFALPAIRKTLPTKPNLSAALSSFKGSVHTFNEQTPPNTNTNTNTNPSNSNSNSEQHPLPAILVLDSSSPSYPQNQNEPPPLFDPPTRRPDPIYGLHSLDAVGPSLDDNRLINPVLQAHPRDKLNPYTGAAVHPPSSPYPQVHDEPSLFETLSSAQVRIILGPASLLVLALVAVYIVTRRWKKRNIHARLRRVNREVRRSRDAIVSLARSAASSAAGSDEEDGGEIGLKEKGY